MKLRIAKTTMKTNKKEAKQSEIVQIFTNMTKQLPKIWIQNK